MSEPEMTDARPGVERQDTPREAPLKQPLAQDGEAPAAGPLGALRRHPIRVGVGLIVVVAACAAQAAVDLASAQILQAQGSVAIASAQIYEQSATIEEIGRTVVEAQAALDFSMQENARYISGSRRKRRWHDAARGAIDLRSGIETSGAVGR